MPFKHPTIKKPSQILFSKNKYSSKVKVNLWDYAREGEPKDHNPYVELTSNHISTYDRLGQDRGGRPHSETRDMLEQIWTKGEVVYAYKPLVNFTSYTCTDTPARNKLLQEANLPQLPANFGTMDYRSSHQRDYRVPHPNISKPLVIKSPVFLMNRIIRSDLTHSGGTAPPRGNYQCLDTHTPIDHIRKLRLFRYVSVDPATGLQEFPKMNW